MTNIEILIILLQQCLPFAVLKLPNIALLQIPINQPLQQCLPFAVLKPITDPTTIDSDPRCNSAYRLRY